MSAPPTTSRTGEIVVDGDPRVAPGRRATRGTRVTFENPGFPDLTFEKVSDIDGSNIAWLPSSSLERVNIPGEVLRFYVDYDAGNDANDGLQAALPLKTLEEWRSRVPRGSYQGTLLLLIKPRGGAATYKKKDGFTDDPLDLSGLSGWQRVIARASDFGDAANDRIVCGGVTVPGLSVTGYNPTGTITADEFDVQINGGGAPALPTEPAILLKRIRFDAATATLALQNFATHVYMNDAGHIKTGTTLPAVPVDSVDVFYIEEPALVVAGVFQDPGAARGQQPVTVGVRTTPGTPFVLGTAAFCESFGGSLASAGLATAPCTTNSEYVAETGALVTVGPGLRFESPSSVFFQFGAVALQATALLCGFGSGIQVNACRGFAFGFRGCVLSTTLSGLIVRDTGRGVAGSDEQLGSEIGSSGSRPLRMLTATTLIRLIRSKLQLNQIDVTDSAGIEIAGVGGVYTDSQGSLGVAAAPFGLLFSQTAEKNIYTVVSPGLPTFSGTVADIGLRGLVQTPASWTDLGGSGTPLNVLKDVAGNEIFWFSGVTPAHRPIGDVEAFLTGGPVGQYRVIRDDGGPLVEAIADSEAHASRILGVSQHATNPADGFPVLLVVDGPTWIEFSVDAFNPAPTVGDTAYLSFLGAPAGRASTTLPAFGVKLGAVLFVDPAYPLSAFVDLNIEPVPGNISEAVLNGDSVTLTPGSIVAYKPGTFPYNVQRPKNGVPGFTVVGSGADVNVHVAGVVVGSSIAAGKIGRIVTSGEVDVQMIGGMPFPIPTGARVYLAGGTVAPWYSFRGAVDPPTTVDGQWAVPIGYVKNGATYTGVAGDLVRIDLSIPPSAHLMSREYSNGVETTDSTSTRILSNILQPDSSSIFEIDTVAKSSLGATSGQWRRIVSVTRDSSGAAVINLVSDVHTWTDAGLLVTYAISGPGNELLIDVQSPGGGDYWWAATVRQTVIKTFGAPS